MPGAPPATSDALQPTLRKRSRARAMLRGRDSIVHCPCLVLLLYKGVYVSTPRRRTRLWGWTWPRHRSASGRRARPWCSGRSCRCCSRGRRSWAYGCSWSWARSRRGCWGRAKKFSPDALPPSTGKQINIIRARRFNIRDWAPRKSFIDWDPRRTAIRR
jgi:hypothetical protein